MSTAMEKSTNQTSACEHVDKPQIAPVCVEKQERILSTGDGERNYCAFPTVLELEKDRVLAAWKQGFAHAADEGIIRYAVIAKSGSLLERGTAATVPDFNAQNVELTRLANGRILMWLDIQDYRKRKSRMGSIAYEYKDGKFIELDGILTDTAGTKYGYVFDSLTWNSKDYMIAMTFPELGSQRSTHILTTVDGKTWIQIADLNALIGDAVNESSFAVLNEKLYVFSRGDNAATYMTVLNKEGQLLCKHVYQKEEGIYKTGRPKLFVYNQVLWGIMRNHAFGDTMTLALICFHADTLSATKIYTLDDAGIEISGDGYYAEQYFDGKDLCVVTYKPQSKGRQPDIVLMRFPWNEGHPGRKRAEIALEGAKKTYKCIGSGYSRNPFPGKLERQRHGSCAPRKRQRNRFL